MPANNSAKPNTPFNFSLKAFAERSFLLISSSILRLSVQLIIIFIYSRQLSVIDYGIYQSVWLYVNVISIISLFGLPSLILSTSLLQITLWIKQRLKLFTAIALFVNLLPVVYVLYSTTTYNYTIKLLMIALVAVQNLSVITETIAIKNKKEKIVLASNLIFSAGFLIGHLYIIYTGYLLSQVLTCILVMLIVKILVLLFFGKNKITKIIETSETVILKEWLYLGINDVLGVLFKWLDKWVILFFVSISQFALYFNGSYEIPIFGLMLSAVGNIMLVDLSGKKEISVIKVKQIFNHSTLMLASIVFPAFCFLLFYNFEFFTFIFSNKYVEAIPIFIICLFVLPLRITNFTAVLQSYKRSDLIVKGAAIDLLTAIILMIILYPVLELKGLALAFVLSTYVQAAYYLWHTGKLINKPVSYFFPFKKLLLIMLVSITTIACGYLLLRIFIYPYNFIGGIITCSILILYLLWYNYRKGLRAAAE